MPQNLGQCADIHQDELIDEMCMSIISLYTTGPLQVNIDNFRTWHQQGISKRTYLLNVRSEPVACYLLRLIENSDVEHLEDFCFLSRETRNKDSDEAYGKYSRCIVGTLQCGSV